MKKSILKTNRIDTTTTIDKETGEVLDYDYAEHKYITNSKEEFFLGYVSLLAAFSNISGPSIKAYAYLLMYYKAGTPIGLNKGIKQKMAAFMHVSSIGTVNNTLLELKREKLIFSDPDIKGVYLINPRYAFKGSTSDRNKKLKAIIELGCKDC